MKSKRILTIGIVLAVILAVAGLVVTFVVTGVLESGQPVVVRNEQELKDAIGKDAETDEDGNVRRIVFANDIEVEGNLELRKLHYIDLNGYTLTVNGVFDFNTTQEGGATIGGEGTDGEFSGGVVKAEKIRIAAPSAHIEWNAGVQLPASNDPTLFAVRTSDRTFVFSGDFRGADGTLTDEGRINAVGGRLDVETNQAGIDYYVHVVGSFEDMTDPDAVTVSANIHEESTLSIVAEKDVTVARGDVCVSASARDVAVTAETGTSVTLTEGSFGDIAGEGNITVETGVTAGSVSGADVVNNGAVGDISASGDVTVNAGATAGDITAAGKLENNGTVGNVSASEVTGEGEFGEIAVPDPTVIATPVPSVTEFVYNGGAQTVLSGTADYTVAGNTATDVGTYTATLTLTDKNSVWSTTGTNAPVTISWTIEKAEISVAAAMTGWTYGDEANAPAVTGNSGNGAVTVEYKEKGTADSAYTSAVPTAAGEYTVRVTVAETANYNGGSATADFTIAKKSVALPTAGTTSFDYDGNEQTYTPAGFDASVMEITGDVQTNAGTYTATVTLKDTANYVWAGNASDPAFSWTIEKSVARLSADATEAELQAVIDNENYSGAVLGGDLSANVEIGEGRVFTLDLNGHTLSSGRDWYVLNNLGDLTVVDTGATKGKILDSLDDTSSTVQNKGTMRLDGVTVESTFVAVKNDTGTLTVENSVLSSSYAATNAGTITNWATATVKNSEITASSSGVAVYGFSGAFEENGETVTVGRSDIMLENCTLSGKYTVYGGRYGTTSSHKAYVNIVGGELVASGSNASGLNAASGKVVITIGGKVTGPYGVFTYASAGGVDLTLNKDAKINALGINEIEQKNTLTIPDGITVTLSGVLRYYYNVVGEIAGRNVQIESADGRLYASTLAKAFGAADEVSVRLLSDLTESSVKVYAGKTVTVDLNGHTLTGSFVNYGTLTVTDGAGGGKVVSLSGHAVTNTGTLTVNGGTLDAQAHAAAAVYNDLGGTAALNGGTFTRSNETGDVSENKNSYYTLLNHGTMTIGSGVTVTQGADPSNNNFSSMIENGWQNGAQNTEGVESVLTIEGGTFTGGLNTVKNDDWGVLTVKGGVFENVSQAAILNWNVAAVSGGAFTVKDGAQAVILNGYLDSTMDRGELTVTGGTFIGDTVFLRMNGSAHAGTVTIGYSSHQYLKDAVGLIAGGGTVVLGDDYPDDLTGLIPEGNYAVGTDGEGRRVIVSL